MRKRISSGTRTEPNGTRTERAEGRAERAERNEKADFKRNERNEKTFQTDRTLRRPVWAEKTTFDDDNIITIMMMMMMTMMTMMMTMTMTMTSLSRSHSHLYAETAKQYLHTNSANSCAGVNGTCFPARLHSTQCNDRIRKCMIKLVFDMEYELINFSTIPPNH